MDEAAKKHALRMVPYGLYLAGSRAADGERSVSLVSWFTQTSFDPPLVVLGLHGEGTALAAAKETGVLSLNILGSGQDDILKRFFKHVPVENGTVQDLAVVEGANGCPILPDLPAALELEVRETLELGDHATVVCEVVEAHVNDQDAGALSHQEAQLHYAG